MNSQLLLPRETIVFEGDSLTRRSMAPSADVWPLLRMNNWQQSWADLVEDWIFSHRPDLQIRFRQAAIGGSSIFELETRYETQVKPNRPDWILFTLGSNDCSREIPLDDFRARLTAYIRTAKEDNGTRFFYAGGFLPMPGLSESDARHVEKSQVYFQTVREVVGEAGGVVPAIGPRLREKAGLHIAASSYHTFYGDGVHLGALGNHVLAGLVMQELGVFAA